VPIRARNLWGSGGRDVRSEARLVGVLHRRYICVTSALHGRSRSVARALPTCFTGVTRHGAVGHPGI